MQVIKALLSIIFLLLHDIRSNIPLIFRAFWSYAVALTLERCTLLLESFIFQKREKVGEMHNFSSSYPVAILRRYPVPIFITSEILLLVTRCAKTPDDSVYSLRVFNRLRAIWVQHIKAAQLHTSAGNAQKAYCCFEFLLVRRKLKAARVLDLLRLN
jgi:hypothetical protein